jgi:hypothetical protein
MEKHYYNYEEIKFIQHLWKLHYNELGIARFFSKFFSSNYISTILFMFFWIVIMSELGLNIWIIILPVILFFVTFLLMLVDGIYASVKAIKVLEMCQKYVNKALTLNELFAIVE